jgi:hypothetical protein
MADSPPSPCVDPTMFHLCRAHSFILTNQKRPGLRAPRIFAKYEFIVNQLLLN